MCACCSLQEWPHAAYRDNVITRFKRSGAADADVAALQLKLLVRFTLLAALFAFDY